MNKTTITKHKLSITHRLTAYLSALIYALFPLLSTISLNQTYAGDYPVQVDPNQDGERAIVTVSDNGLPIVQIAPPNAGGLSHNQFIQYNVGPDGLILNNSGDTVQTQQAGWIQGNPMLGNSHADTILNEITSQMPSQLEGYSEVAGHEANVIIANPNGITCNGCGTINTPRSTMTTGQAIINENGELTGFNVQQGQITIEGQGYNASNIDRVDLIARSIAINAELWAKELKVVTGTNQVNYQDDNISAQSATTPTPTVAIDVSQLGAMYANSIHMIGTEQGVGVNSQGIIYAITGDLQLDSQGNISFGSTSSTQAEQELNIKTPKTI